MWTLLRACIERFADAWGLVIVDRTDDTPTREINGESRRDATVRSRVTVVRSPQTLVATVPIDAA